MAYDPRTGYRTELPDEAALIRAEVADVVDLGPEERLHLLASACRTGSQLMAMKSPADRARVLEHRDPPHPSFGPVFERLRARFRAHKPR